MRSGYGNGTQERQNETGCVQERAASASRAGAARSDRTYDCCTYLFVNFNFLISVVTMHIKRKLINAPTSSARLSVSYLPVSHSQVNNSIQKESQLNVKHRLLCQHSGGIKQN